MSTDPVRPTIVAGFDGTPQSHAAIHWAAAEAKSRGALLPNRLVEVHPGDQPRGDQQVAELRRLRSLGAHQPAEVETDHRPVASAQQVERAGPPPEMNELHDVRDRDVLKAAGDPHRLL